jgi:2-keto-4-pentenoate hydratase
VSDPRIVRGTAAMLELRRTRIEEGARTLGWKVGFGSPAAFELLGTDRPLVGFLTDRSLVDDGATVAVGDWTTPMLEPEIAVHLAHDVEGDATHDDVRAAVRGLSAAIELADVDVPPADPEPILAGNIYHRHVLLGPVDEGRTTAEGVRGRLLRDGEEIAATDTPEAATGELAEVVRLTAELLAASGERLRAGDVVITGSIVAPVKVAPGESVTAEIDPLGSLTVVLA